MNRPSLVVAAVMAVLCVIGVPRPQLVAALELVIISDMVEADFPSGLTLNLDFESEQKIDEAYVLYTLAHEEFSSEVAAHFDADGSTEASVTIDMETAFVPTGVDLTYRWRLVSDDDSEVVTAPVTIIWEDDRFDWERSASRDVEVFGYSGGEELRSEVLTSAQETVDRLAGEFAVAVEHPLRIWVYANKKDFAGTLAPNSQEWLAGAAYPDLQLILAVIPENRPSEIGRVIPHEVSHQLFDIATDNPYNVPATWLDEGIAVRNQTNGTSHMARLVATADRDGRLLPLTSLDFSFPFDRKNFTLAYAQAFSVVTFLVETYGENSIALIAEAYRAGNTHDDAIKAGIGRDIDQLDADWRIWINERDASVLNRVDVAQVLIFGAPGIGVVAYFVLRRFRAPESYLDDGEAAA